MRDKSLIRGQYGTGQYIIAGDEPCAEDIRNWIVECGYKQYEREDLRFNHRGRPRNKLYGFHLPEAQCEVVMKTCRPAPEYKWPRRLELALKQYLDDYNKAAFLGCRMMYLAGIPVARPFAYWNVRQSLLNQTSYFLYEKVKAECSLDEWCKTIRQSGNNNADDLIKSAKVKAMVIVKEMHDAGLRHSDPHGQNFLVKPVATKSLSTLDVQQTPYHLIDYDQCTHATIRIPPIKRFFDLRELRRTYIDDTDPHQLLDLYLDGKRSWHAHLVLEFWRRGGFHPWRWIFSGAEKSGRHLKKLKTN